MIKKFKKFIFDNYKYLLFSAIFLIINAGLIYNMRSVVGNKILIIALLLIVQIVLLILGFFLKQRKNWEHHQLLLLFSIVLGLMYVFLMPIGTPPDEAHHFRRAYSITNGRLLAVKGDSEKGAGDTLPNSVNELFSYGPGEIRYNKMPDIMARTSEADSESFQEFNNMALYSPIAFIPQSLGIAIGRVLHLPMICIFYLARIFNLAVWILILYFAIKKMPFGKSVLCMILLMPISMQAAASCQADALTNASTMAFTFYKIKKPTLLTKKEIVIAAVLVLFIAMGKIVYLPICFLLLLLPKKCFKDKKHKIILLLSLLGLAVILNLIWLKISSGYLIETNPGVNPSEQVSNILHNPLSYVSVMFRSVFSNGLFYFFSFFGSGLAYFNVLIEQPYILGFAFLLFYIYISENRQKYFLENKQKIFLAAVTIVCIALIFTSLYIQWTAVKAPLIEGVQGRYFIPLVMLILSLLTPLGNNRAPKDMTIYAFASVSALSIYGLASYMCYYLQ